jgi:hypothetical protein
LITFGDKVLEYFSPETFLSLSAFIIPLGVMVNYGDLQFAERIGRLKGDVSSHQYIFQIFGFSESQDGLFFEYFAQFWVFLYGCPVFTNDVVYITEHRMVCDDKWHSVVRILFFLYWRSFLSIPLALLKQWLMLAL